MSTVEDQEFGELLSFLKQSRGLDLGAYKTSTLKRRIEKRKHLNHVERDSEYVEFLEVHPEEFQQLFNTILINVTSFFRDPDAWEYIAQEVVPAILSSKVDDQPVRAWCAGVASGEEAYSLAMILCEALGSEKFRDRVKIYATDVDDEALALSRSAVYSVKETAGVPKDLVEKYFERNNDKLTFDRDVRRSVIFGRHDLIQDAPISRVDLLLCRNTLMYFNSEAQARILNRFHFAITDSGYLFLGKAETLLNQDMFVPADLKRRVFAKLPRGKRRDRGPMREADEVLPLLLDGHVRLREAVLDNVPIAQMVVDATGRLYLANDRARNMFGLSLRDIGRPIQDLEISYRPVELRSGIEQASGLRRPIEFKGVSWTSPIETNMVLDLRLAPMIDESGKLLGVSITWEDVTHFKRLQDELVNFNQELETAYEELQSTNEELQTTNEELQSTVEELETTNEELQSTNEELETMNEELQSTNEELETINDEFKQRSDELNEANAFLKAILSSFGEGVIVLDKEMNVLAWNPASEEVWGLRSEDVVSKHFMNLDIGLPVEKLRPLIKASLADGAAHQNVELTARNRRGKTIHCLSRVMSLSRSNGEKRGVIIVTKEIES